MGLKIKKKYIDYIMVKVLIILMPIHNMVFDILILGEIDNIWRDVLLLIGIGFAAFEHISNFKLGKYGKIIAFGWIVILLYTLFSERLMLSLNLARTYIVPALVYFILINSSFNLAEIEKIENIFVLEAALIAVWGIYQAFVLGDQFLINLGYTRGRGNLPNSFYINGFYGIQRVTGTLASPNICGVYFGMAILVVQGKLRENRKFILMFIILMLGLVTTFSRSAIFGTGIGLVIYYWSEIKKMRFKPKLFLSVIVLIWGMVLIDYTVLNGLVSNMLYRNFTTMINLTDASAAKHFLDLWEPLKHIITRPLGLGFGYSGPIVLFRYGTANLVESSIYLLIYNFGIFGMVVFLWPMLNNSISIRKPTNMINKYSCVICAEVLFTYLLLPNVETYEILFFVYFFIALCEKKKYNLY